MEGNSPVHVKMKVGAVEFEIQCNIDELRNVVDKILASVSKSELGRQEAASPIARTRMHGITGRGETCKSIILDLWNDGWFQVGRSLGDVHGEMGRQGFHYDRTAVAHALVDLVREGILTRVGRPRRYQYLQKRPPALKPSDTKE